MWSGERLAFVAPLLEEGVETLANQRAGAVAGVLGDHPQAGRALGAQVVRIAFGRKAFLLQLRAGAERGFQLTGIVLAIMAGERQIVDVERPLGDVFPDAQRRKLDRA